MDSIEHERQLVCRFISILYLLSGKSYELKILMLLNSFCLLFALLPSCTVQGMSLFVYTSAG